MKKNSKYDFVQLASAGFMILALLWLTISAPFVNAAQEEIAKLANIEKSATPLSGSEEESTNPFGNSTEEKAPSGTSLSEEFLHGHPHTDHFFSIALQYHKGENTGLYIAFHGELHVPPPNVA